MMRQLSNPVCLRLKPQRDWNKLRNKSSTEPAESKLHFYYAPSERLRPAYTLIVGVLLFDVFNGWVCAAMFGGSSHQSWFTGPRREWGNLEKCLESLKYTKTQTRGKKKRGGRESEALKGKRWTRERKTEREETAGQRRNKPWCALDVAALRWASWRSQTHFYSCFHFKSTLYILYFIMRSLTAARWCTKETNQSDISKKCKMML